MKSFAQLFDELDSTTSTIEKVSALEKYFQRATAEDSMWTILLLTGRISKKVVTVRVLRDLFIAETGYAEWMFEECYAQVGDTAETLSLLANSLGLARQDDSTIEEKSLTHWMEQEIPALARIEETAKKSRQLLAWWRTLDPSEIFILNKLMTGAFRVGVSEKLVIRALANVHKIPSDQIAHRLTGRNSPGAAEFARLISQEKTEITFSQPYPFCLAHAWSERKDQSWDPTEWDIEWKYDGIRSQVIRRNDQLWIWSRGEDDITSSFPDLRESFMKIPNGTVIDGEILVIDQGKVRPFQDLQKRLGRKKVPAATLKSHPAGFIGYDVLEFQGIDLREKPLGERKTCLDEVLMPILNDSIRISPILSAPKAEDLETLRSQSRDHEAEGLMIKSWQSPYSVGRRTGDWWKHKVDPLTLDAVLIYAQAGTGRRANLYTDYTFALWSEDKKLVPFAKAYSGLDQKEIDELDHWIRQHTKEKFGPVRSVEPHFVFEIGFEGILKSSRHKSGIAVRFPRILRWRKDKKFDEADSLETANGLLEATVSQ